MRSGRREQVELHHSSRRHWPKWNCWWFYCRTRHNVILSENSLHDDKDTILTCTIRVQVLPHRLSGSEWIMAVALPAVQTFADSVDWSKTVSPFVPQLYDLPSEFISRLNNLQSLKELYLSTNPLISAFAFCLVLFPIFLIAAEVNRNWSQVDRCWSILPTVYNIHYAVYAHLAGLPTKRLDTLAFFSIIWSVCL